MAKGDVIVTTPMSLSARAAEEARVCHEEFAERGAVHARYFRRFGRERHPSIAVGDRVFYVDQGAVRGFAVVDRIEEREESQHCDVAEADWGPGFYLWMRPDSWTWIVPIPLKGFQGFRYTGASGASGEAPWPIAGRPVIVSGGWLDPMPKAPAFAERWGPE